MFKDWFEVNESRKHKIRNLVDGHNFIMFFTKDNGVFGAPEESRLVFAKMKTPDEETPDGWADEASFAAFDMIKALAGDKVQNLFSKKDLKKIKIIDRNAAENILLNLPGSCPCQDVMKVGHDKEGAGIIKLKDRN